MENSLEGIWLQNRLRFINLLAFTPKVGFEVCLWDCAEFLL